MVYEFFQISFKNYYPLLNNITPKYIGNERFINAEKSYFRIFLRKHLNHKLKRRKLLTQNNKIIRRFGTIVK